MTQSAKPSFVNLLQEFSIPLILGVFVALTVANIDHHLYEVLVDTPLHKLPGVLLHGLHDPIARPTGWAYYFTLHFLVNDIFMVFFFGIAAKEITESCLPGGSLNPITRAINPLLATLGGIVGPVGVYFLLNAMIGAPEWKNGWGIPTATDIALAWLIARFVFGASHPAVSFLLLLAIADDAIGLVIIAVFYPDPHTPTEWANLLWVLPGIIAAFGLRRAKIMRWLPYVLVGGGFTWWGLYSAGLHPALALVLIVPFIPGPKGDIGIFAEDRHFEDKGKSLTRSPLENFEHQLKLPVDFGLFFFAFANAGVPFANITNLTWIVLLALSIGKTLGVALFSTIGHMAGIPRPNGMDLKHVVVAGLIAGIGLTVALFVSAQAFVDSGIQAAAKMGALLSGVIALPALILGALLKVKDKP